MCVVASKKTGARGHAGWRCGEGICEAYPGFNKSVYIRSTHERGSQGSDGISSLLIRYNEKDIRFFLYHTFPFLYRIAATVTDLPADLEQDPLIQPTTISFRTVLLT
jgi:hypothetical protein